ncbi:MAG: YqeG family HAD IIIA-type phosphatase [Defluviitaleaceae bacterium]|nr:YqeG family HAD IIIA-type phosphatase [Defluviitaleaceae bacterium]
MLKKIFKPNFYFGSIFQIPYDDLRQKGVKGLIFDIDNTLARHEDIFPPEKILSLICNLQNTGFKIGILSNNSKKRLEEFNRALQLPGFSGALKPFTVNLKKLMIQMNLKPTETAIIGDQMFADVWCGNRANITTVLVKPITEQEIFIVRLKRGLERRMIKKYLGYNL